MKNKSTWRPIEVAIILSFPPPSSVSKRVPLARRIEEKREVARNLQGLTYALYTDFATRIFCTLILSFNIAYFFVLSDNFLAAQPVLKCYKCLSSGQECRYEVVSKNRSAQVACEGYEDRCYWAYQRVNSSLEYFTMGCITKPYCEKVPREAEEAVRFNLIECFDISCCDSDFCNKPMYTGRY